MKLVHGAALIALLLTLGCGGGAMQGKKAASPASEAPGEFDAAKGFDGGAKPQFPGRGPEVRPGWRP